MATIRAVDASDRSAWQPLWDAYVTFYESTVPEDVTDSTFARIVEDDELHGAMAWDDDGEAIGLVHWLFHAATWSKGTYCYLEDLFVCPAARGKGAAKALIEHVNQAARAAGSDKVYWITHESNVAAQALYDRVATRTGFIHYEQTLN